MSSIRLDEVLPRLQRGLTQWWRDAVPVQIVGLLLAIVTVLAIVSLLFWPTTTPKKKRKRSPKAKQRQQTNGEEGSSNGETQQLKQGSVEDSGSLAAYRASRMCFFRIVAWLWLLVFVAVLWAKTCEQKDLPRVVTQIFDRKQPSGPDAPEGTIVPEEAPDKAAEAAAQRQQEQASAEAAAKKEEKAAKAASEAAVAKQRERERAAEAERQAAAADAAAAERAAAEEAKKRAAEKRAAEQAAEAAEAAAASQRATAETEAQEAAAAAARKKAELEAVAAEEARAAAAAEQRRIAEAKELESRRAREAEEAREAAAREAKAAKEAAAREAEAAEEAAARRAREAQRQEEAERRKAAEAEAAAKAAAEKEEAASRQEEEARRAREAAEQETATLQVELKAARIRPDSPLRHGEELRVRDTTLAVSDAGDLELRRGGSLVWAAEGRWHRKPPVTARFLTAVGADAPVATAAALGRGTLRVLGNLGRRVRGRGASGSDHAGGEELGREGNTQAGSDEPQVEKHAGTAGQQDASQRPPCERCFAAVSRGGSITLQEGRRVLWAAAPEVGVDGSGVGSGSVSDEGGGEYELCLTEQDLELRRDGVTVWKALGPATGA